MFVEKMLFLQKSMLTCSKIDNGLTGQEEIKKKKY